MTLALLMNMGFAGGGTEGAAAGPSRLMLMGIGSHLWWLIPAALVARYHG